MIAKLLTTLCLAAFAAGLDDQPFDILRTLGIYPSDHITVSARVQPADLYLYNGPRYYIPHGSCQGYLDTNHLCGLEDVQGIEVKVSDPNNFARVLIHKEVGEVEIRRRGIDNNLFCPGAALVDLRLSCDHWQFSHSRNRLRLPSLDPSKSSQSDEEDDADDQSAEEDSSVEDEPSAKDDIAAKAE